MQRVLQGLMIFVLFVLLSGPSALAAPTLTARSPAAGSTWVATSPTLSATFSEAVSPDLVTAAGFTFGKQIGIVAIAAGEEHTLALRDDGTVVAWPYYMSVPEGLSGVVAIAAGKRHSVALKGDGTVVAWGDNYFGQTNIPAGLNGVVAIDAGDRHTVAVKGDGTVVAWGSNGSGQTSVPAGLSGVVAITAGYAHTVALKGDGTVVAWGSNGSGQTSVPVDLSGVVAIAAGYAHTVALKGDGTVVAWGSNGNGQTSVPAGLNGVVAIAAGSEHTVVVKWDGTVVAWGSNYYSYGEGVFEDWVEFGQATVPAGLSGVVAVAAGGGHTVALLRDGTMAAWGANGSCGAMSVSGGPNGVVAVAAGYYRTVALKGDGTMAAWGAYPNSLSSAPAGLDRVVAIAAGYAHTVALKGDGTVVAWGSNGSGQTSVPAGLSGVVAITAGYAHTVALKGAGTVVAWGSNGSGQTSVPADLSGVVAIAAGYAHTVALKGDGTVVAWGSNGSGQTSVPAGLNGVVAIAAGYAHTVALKEDGTVVAWGDNQMCNDYGECIITEQATVPAGLSGVVAIAAGYAHSVALKGDGTVVAWGANQIWEYDREGYFLFNTGQAIVPTGLGRVVAIAAGMRHTVALQGDGTVVAWGDNYFGQTNVPPFPSFTAIPTTAGYSQSSHKVTLTSEVPLAASALYRARVFGVAANGAALTGGYEWFFSTGESLSNYLVLPQAGLHGSITPATGRLVMGGAITEFSLLPAAGYGIDQVDGCGGTLAGNLFTTAPVGAACSVKAAFRALPNGGMTITSNDASPSYVGTPIPFMAAASGGSGNYEYKFLYKTPAGSWVTARDYAASPTWSWTTAGLPAGTYVVVAQARNVGSTADAETSKGMNYVLTIPPPASAVTLTPSDASPSYVGTPIPFMAAASGGSGNYEYKFLYKTPAGSWVTARDYAASPTWSWTTAGLPAGTYVVVAQARNVGSTADAETSKGMLYVLAPPPPATSVTLAANDASPSSVGMQISFTVAASGGSGNYEYKFLYKAPDGIWVTARDYALTPAWDWVTTGLAAGTYVVVVQTRSFGSTADAEASKGVSYILYPPANSVVLTPNDASPSYLGTPIPFTAAASGGSGNYEYKFLYKIPAGNWVTGRDYAASPTWNWGTAGLPAGTYVVVAQARNVGSSADAEAAKGMNYVLTIPPPASAVSLAPSEASPSYLGTPITFTAAASGASGYYEYKFLYKTPSGSWVTARDYAATPTWNWTTAGLSAGAYVVVVQARNIGSTAASDAAKGVTYVLE